MDDLQTEEGKALLDAIEALREQGINDEVSLPQLIVVGQQSSGKSSVLEAISGIKFPVGEGTCTKFATEVVLRKHPKELGRVTIVPHQECSDERRKQLSAFDRNDVDFSSIGDYIQKASNEIGVSSGQDFTEDVLRIELSGPSQPHLTLVDLPGLIANDISKGKELVWDLVTNYMKKPRAIILAVVSARDYPNNAVVLDLLKNPEIPGAFERTLGIITGPDRMDRGSTMESGFRGLIENELYPLKLGWHVLRNPNFSERNRKHFRRDEKEANFLNNTSPWNEIHAEKRGIKKLHLRLSNILMAHIRLELPKIIETIDMGIADCETKMNELGESRPSSKDKEAFLVDIGRKYQTLVKAALDGVYSLDFFVHFDRRLRTRVQEASDSFANIMQGMGHTWEIDSRADSETAANSRPIGSRKHLVGSSIHISKEVYTNKIRRHLEENRGPELSMEYNPRVVGDIFRDQSFKWQKLAEEYAETITMHVNTLLENAVQSAAGPETASAILEHKIRPEMEKRQLALEGKIKEILQPFQRGWPVALLPHDMAFNITENFGTSKGTPAFVFGPSLPMDDRDLACKKILDTSQSYYKNALRVFVYNIVTLAIEWCLLDGLDELISPTMICRMEPEEWEHLGSESAETIALREKTSKKLEALKKGRRYCRPFAVKMTTTDPVKVTAVDETSDLSKQFDKITISEIPSTPTSSKSRSTASSRAGSSPKTPVGIIATPPKDDVLGYDLDASSPGAGEPFGRPARSPHSRRKANLSPGGLKVRDNSQDSSPLGLRQPRREDTVESEL